MILHSKFHKALYNKGNNIQDTLISHYGKIPIQAARFPSL